MPIHKEGSGYQWGQHGHVYATKAGAEKQAEAAHANGFQDAIDTESCAGLLLVTQDRRFLLLHRTASDEWEGPGGHGKDGESEVAAAIRETFEEVGPIPLDEPFFFGRTDAYGVDYFTYTQCVPQFRPILNEEHDSFKWVTAHELPETTHPGTKYAIQAIAGTDLAVARSIALQFFPSPQRYETAWLFDLRVTGTGLSLRPDLNEWVYRPPEFYMNPEFLARCNGVPVLFEHTGKEGLDTEAWRQRAIGSLVHAYLPTRDDEKHRMDEVWAIARVYDGDAAELMATTHISTSPAVTFEDPESLKYVRADDGKRLLIEGNPSYIEHLAVCPAGVWDKGEEPRGIVNN